MLEVLQTSHFIDNLLFSLSSSGNLKNDEFFVHSIYEKTINLMLKNQLVALQTEGSPLSPLSVILPLNRNEMAKIKVHTGMPVKIAPDKLIIDGTVLIFSENTAKYDSHLISYNHNKELNIIIGEMLVRAKRGGFSKILLNKVAANDIVLNFAKKKLLACISIIDNIPANELTPLQIQNFIENIVALIGVGSGLTPSGDDFICGILAAMSSSKTLCNSNLHNGLRRAVNSNLERTNAISAAFLRCAADSEFSLPVIELLRDVAEIKSCDYVFIKNHLKSFLEIGHSSGIDTLSGMYWAMSNLI